MFLRPNYRSKDGTFEAADYARSVTVWGELAAIRERLVEITREVYGLAHPATGHSIKNLVALLQEMGDHGAAGKLIEEFLAAARAAGIRLPPNS